jgi:hypothetical protein
VLTIFLINNTRKDYKDIKMPQEFQSSVRTYKYPFELIMKVGQWLDNKLTESETFRRNHGSVNYSLCEK